MNTLRIKLSLLALGIAFLANAQVDSFKLTDYKLPYLKRRALETSSSLSSRNKHNIYNHNDISTKRTHKTNTFDANFNIIYTDFVNMQKRQSESKMRFYFVSDFDNNKFSDSNISDFKNNSKALISALEINKKDKFYFTPKFFFELAPLVNYRFIENNTDSKVFEYDDNQNNTTKKQNARLQVALKVGKGRITQVQDARHALYIIEKLKTQNRMKVDDVTNEEIVEFANFIAGLKNKRFFDSRIRHIAEIDAVDSFLIAHNYIDKSDARYFTTLDDIWQYGDICKRWSGTRISFAIVPAFRFNDFDESKKGSMTNKILQQNNKTFSLDGGLELAHQKPINLYWQHSLNASMYLGFMSGNQMTKPGNRDSQLEIPKIQMGINHDLGFYPNTRTHIKMGYHFKFLKTFDAEDIGDKIMINTMAFNLGANLSAHYYINPRLRITFSSVADILKTDGNASPNIINFNDDFINVVYPVFHDLKITETNVTTRFIANFNINLTYSIF